MMTKADLRRSIRTRLSLTAEERAKKSHAICRAIARSEAWQSAGTVGIFAPQTTEPDVELLWQHANEKRICYPRVAGSGMAFHAVADPAALLVGRWGIRNPDPRHMPTVNLCEIELLLVPGVAFTKSGARLGRGGGYYDRLLAQLRLDGGTLGTCFDLQLVDSLPTETHDRPVARVVTESGFHEGPLGPLMFSL
jgi:5-formyltetrahydrofolate cyclo-ligase